MTYQQTQHIILLCQQGWQGLHVDLDNHFDQLRIGGPVLLINEFQDLAKVMPDGTVLIFKNEDWASKANILDLSTTPNS